jgi:hypothetical protein
MVGERLSRLQSTASLSLIDKCPSIECYQLSGRRKTSKTKKKIGKYCGFIFIIKTHKCCGIINIFFIFIDMEQSFEEEVGLSSENVYGIIEQRNDTIKFGIYWKE